eukprot:CAMPEP_0115139280 /NCGR_PEP_ID=MMETSP0227-20121206/58187_1 /TAXON_ID=89957 /ORGANISM="Polarella glacialis, Strain CCMP 1383" /LENGTH=348 /DNA_ID=CAMNT_0002547099 /DNA_START=42 /DNA_END=1084 /DNA_ORIENTATION=+
MFRSLVEAEAEAVRHNAADQDLEAEDPDEGTDAAPGQPTRGCLRFRRQFFAALAAAALLLWASGSSTALRPLATDASAGFSRLWSLRAGLIETRPAEDAECLVDAGNMALYVSRAGLELNEATQFCPEIATWCEDHASSRGCNLTGTRLLLRVLGDAPGHDRDRAPSMSSVALPEMAHRAAQVASSRAMGRLRPVLARRNASVMSPNLSAAFADLAERNAIHNLFVQDGRSHHFGQTLGRRVEESKVDISKPSNLDETKDRCAATITGFIASMSYMTAYLSALISECPDGNAREPFCASDLAKMIASLSELLAGGFGIAESCDDSGVTSDDAGDITRRLGMEPLQDRG